LQVRDACLLSGVLRAKICSLHNIKKSLDSVQNWTARKILHCMIFLALKGAIKLWLHLYLARNFKGLERPKDMACSLLSYKSQNLRTDFSVEE
jgi:hypothetical protein